MARAKIKVKIRTHKVGSGEHEVLITSPHDKDKEISLGKYPKEIADNVLKQTKKAIRIAIEGVITQTLPTVDVSKVSEGDAT